MMEPRVRLPDIRTLVFAGGGNRCWWQAGVLARLSERGAGLPGTLVGTSAGAAIAAACLTDGPEAALRACRRLYAANTRMLDWRGLGRLRLKFAHQHIYPAWVGSFVHEGNFATLKHAPCTLLVAVTRPAVVLGLGGSIAAGTLAYLLDKKVYHSIHPRLPKFLGLRQEFLHLQQCGTAREAQTVLCAAAAAPPLMHSVRLAGKWAFDGGYTDNAPIPPESTADKASTLVLLTRHYPNRPAVFEWQGRAYWQPSRPVPVSTWSCTHETTVEDAFALGYQDAADTLDRHAIALR
ncbi:patatin-like phospholipase family protein [Ralstonia solanacearum]|uniref:patatin-like phospholipase family protein n=1 Tax=Ralstonia solanacearum TaxID=305 RepID=UPI00078DFB2E|nr:patatin-like phospholipase family protein [Ralstonia solanacearum]AMP40512.1 patatin [Ralstonia solanacearum]